MSNRFVFRIIVVVSGLLLPTFGHGDERILSYHSDITIAEDASMTVAETIRVRAEGVNIRRGIYRDFPTQYSDKYGNRFVVDFAVLGVTRDGAPEPWRTTGLSNGVRVYIGNADVSLNPGEYSYTIRYRTNRQIGYFEDHDELYWNVTGNGWAFAMDEASATVTLPGFVSSDDISILGYTGRFGANGQAYTVAVSNGEASIRTTRYLDSLEGLTLAVSWPKGVVAEPGAVERLGYLLTDNRGLLLALVTLFSVAAYLYSTWSRYGKDPEPGVIFPHYDPPSGYSPASARYVTRMSYDSKALSAAVINLAVKGYLTIVKADDDYLLRQESSTEQLANGESVLLQKLFEKGGVLELDNKNHPIVGQALAAHKKALRQDYRDVYFLTNTRRLMPAFLGSLAMLVVIGSLGAITPFVVGLFIIIAVLHGVFGYLLKAPTAKGRELMDKLEGFKLYLEVAEKDDLNLRHPPDMSPQLFEQYLPFAVALGVEQNWAEQFTRVFASLKAEHGVDYHPRWYDGSFSYRNLGGFADNVSSGFSTAISSAASPPGSASGAGGSSGGGGGGGGGGGW